MTASHSLLKAPLPSNADTSRPPSPSPAGFASGHRNVALAAAVVSTWHEGCSCAAPARAVCEWPCRVLILAGGGHFCSMPSSPGCPLWPESSTRKEGTHHCQHPWPHLAPYVAAPCSWSLGQWGNDSGEGGSRDSLAAAATELSTLSNCSLLFPTRSDQEQSWGSSSSMLQVYHSSLGVPAIPCKGSRP